MIKVRLVGRRAASRKPGTPRPLVGGRVLGEIDEYFIEQLTPGDTFVFAGEVLRFEGLQETEAFVSRTHAIPIPRSRAIAGGKFPLSTHLAERVRAHAGRPSQAGGGCRSRWRVAGLAGRALGRCRAPTRC